MDIEVTINTILSNTTRLEMLLDGELGGMVLIIMMKVKMK
jgi:hypothetical protein